MTKRFDFRFTVFLVSLSLLFSLWPPVSASADPAFEGSAVPGGTTVQTSGGSSSAALIDGNAATGWTSTLQLSSSNGPWITLTFPVARHVSAVQLLTSAPTEGSHKYAVLHTTCCDQIRIGEVSTSVSNAVSNTVIPVKPGAYKMLTLTFQGTASGGGRIGLTVYEIRLLPIGAPSPQGATPGDREVSLVWSPVAADTLVGYKVYRDGTLLATTTETSYTATGLVNGQSYTFAVTAYDTGDWESEKVEWTGVVPRDGTPPAAPTGLSAAPGDSAVALSWVPNAEYDIAHYRVYVNGELRLDGVTGTEATVSGLDNDMTYTFAVTAFDTSSNESPLSAPATATPGDSNPPAVPTGLFAARGDGSVALAWADNEENDFAFYRVYVDGVLTADAVYETSYIVENLTNDTTYSFSVSAVDEGGNESAPSSPVSATPTDLTPPAAPAGLAATPGDGAVTLAWDANEESDVAAYRVYIDGARIADGLTATGYTVSGLTNDTTFTFTITAVDGHGNESVPSSPVAATPTDLTPPAAPAGLAATPGDGAVTLAWDANVESDFAFYKVYANGAPIATGVTDHVYTVTGLTNGTLHTFAVAAVDARGNESAQSTPVAAAPNVQSLRVVLDSHMLEIDEVRLLRVEFLKADGTAADVTDEIAEASTPPSEQPIVEVSTGPLRALGVRTGQTTVTIRYQGYTVSVPLFVNHEEWVKEIVNPTPEPTGIAHLVQFAVERRVDLTGDGHFDAADVGELLELVESKFLESH